MWRHPDYYRDVLTKVEMLSALDSVLTRFYGCKTRLVPKFRKLPKDSIWQVYQAVYYWRNDSLSEQVFVMDEWISVVYPA